jgi:hypothetical protein
MQPRLAQSYIKLVISFSLVLLAVGAAPVAGDDTGILGRLFRFGGSSDSSASGPSFGANSPNGGSASSSSGSNPPASSNPYAHPGVSNFNGLPQTPVTTPPVADGPSQRLVPRSRVSPAVTTADPVLTRFALGRSNDGSQFAMALQVFADGTVIDSDGVHHVRAVDLRPIVETVQSGELYRMRGHCGAPSTDFIEYVHVVIYERRLGRLSAHSFSYAGNGQGCDQSIRHLHAVVENLQTKLSRQSGAANPAVGAGAVPGIAPSPVGSSPISGSGSSSPFSGGSGPTGGPALHGYPGAPAVNPEPSGGVIPLTPVDSPR